MNVIFHGKLGVLKRFDVGALPPLKTSGTRSINFETFLSPPSLPLCVCVCVCVRACMLLFMVGKKVLLQV